MLVTKHKKLAKLVTATFALNTMGGVILPIASAAEQAATVEQNSKTTTEQAKKDAAVEAAKSYKQSVDAAYKSIITLDTENDDDLQFLNKVISLCTDSSGKVAVADTYEKLMDGARDAQETAEANGKDVDAMTKKLLDVDQRVHKIANNLKDSGTMNTDAVPENVVKAAIATYQKGVADRKVCEAEADQKGTDRNACKLSEDAASAANFLLTKNLQQVNVSATSGVKTNAVEQKGASTIKNKDTHWYKGDDGLWYEKTTETEVACADDEEAKDGKCVKKEVKKDESGKDDTIKCADGEEIKDGKCVKKEPAKTEESKKDDTIKCTDDEEAVDGKCVKKEPKKEETQCADGEDLKDGKCVKKEDSKEDEKCPTDKGYVSSNGQCCPADYPEYNSATQKCTKKAEENKDNGNGNSGSGNNNKLLSALGTLGAVAGLLNSGGSNSGYKKQEVSENGLQYTFNYLQGKQPTSKGEVIHMFPMNTDMPIKFKLFQYRLPDTPAGTKVEPKAEAHVMMTMRDANGKWTGKTVVIPLKINEMTMLFPKTTDEGGTVYLPLKALGSIERVPASTFGLPYYTMTVVADDGVSGHLREFNIKYDFTGTTNYIQANPDKKLSKGTNVVEGQAPTIGLDGFVQGAAWDAATQTCKIDVTGTFTDNAANERYDTGDAAYTITSDRYTEEGCGKITNAKGYAVHIEGLGESDDGKGNRILSDKDAQNAKIAIYDDATVFKNDGNTVYNEGVLKYTDYKDEYQKDLVYSRRPADFTVTYADGHTESWPGYSSDGVTLYDTDGNPLTDSQKAKEVQLVCNMTGNADACNNGVKFDACTANEDPNRLGMVCLYRKDGSEVSYSGEGFNRNTIEAQYRIGKADAEMQGITNNSTPTFDANGNIEAGTGIFRGVVDTVKQIGKNIYDTVIGAETKDQKATIDNLAGTKNADQKDKDAVMQNQADAVNGVNKDVSQSKAKAETGENLNSSKGESDSKAAGSAETGGSNEESNKGTVQRFTDGSMIIRDNVGKVVRAIKPFQEKGILASQSEEAVKGLAKLASGAGL